MHHFLQVILKIHVSTLKALEISIHVNIFKKNMYILRGYIYNYMCKFVNQYLIKDKKHN